MQTSSRLAHFQVSVFLKMFSVTAECVPGHGGQRVSLARTPILVGPCTKAKLESESELAAQSYELEKRKRTALQKLLVCFKMHVLLFGSWSGAYTQ